MSVHKLIHNWIEAKETEIKAVAARREAEDALIKALRVDVTQEGVLTQESDDFVIKITRRLDRKVDVGKVTEIAAEHDLTHMLSDLFRWKAEINKSAWNACAPDLVAPLLQAITTKPGRPSFSIIKKEQ